MFGEIYNQSILKPCKSHGTRWIANKVKAMEAVLIKDGIYIKYLVSANADGQALKHSEIEGEAKKWKNVFPIAIYLDVLTPLKV